MENLSFTKASKRSHFAAICGAVWAVSLLLATASRAETGPFAGLDGNWSGGGSVSLGNGSKERIRCVANYAAAGDTLRQNLRCASDSYRFELSGSVAYLAGQLSGTWTEASRNLSGALFGTATGGQFSLVVTSPSFSANLSLTTRGDQQSIVITAPPGGQLVGASITMTRKR